jgi:hypothetical protein
MLVPGRLLIKLHDERLVHEIQVMQDPGRFFMIVGFGETSKAHVALFSRRVAVFG